MGAVNTRSFYRVAKARHPSDEEYLSPKELGRKPKKNATAEELWSQDALSSWDTEEGARNIGRMFPKAGHLIVRYDIPDGAGVTYEQTLEEGHYDLRGEKEELKGYLALDFMAEV